MKYFIILILLQVNIIGTNAILAPTVICSSKHNGLTDLNNVLQIDMQDARRFSQFFNLTFKRDHVEWFMESYTSWSSTNTSYEIGISGNVYHDLNLALTIFNMELFIDIDIMERIPILLCGVIIGRNTSPYEEFEKRITCKPIPSYPSYYYDNDFLKVRFSQIMGQNILMYKFTEDDVVLYSIPNTASMLLSKLAFITIPGTNSTRQRERPGFSAYFHNCLVGFDEDRYSYSSSFWLVKTGYEFKRLLLSTESLCDTVTERGIYNVLYRNELNAMNDIIEQVQLFPGMNYINSSETYKGIYIELHGNFNLIKLQNTQIFSMFQVNMTKIQKAFAWKPLSILAFNQFSLSMTQYVSGECFVFIQNLLTGIIEEQIYLPYEKFNLTQTPNGIIGITESSIMPPSLYGFPNFYILRATCDTVVETNDSVFEITSDPVFRLDREVTECST